MRKWLQTHGGRREERDGSDMVRRKRRGDDEDRKEERTFGRQKEKSWAERWSTES